MVELRDAIPENIVITSSSFLKLLETLVNHFGSAGESMVFQMGLENGMLFCKDVLDSVNPRSESLDELFSLVLEHASKAGWANMVIEELNLQTGSIKVELRDNTFKSFCLRKNLPQCFFLRGYLSGIIKELTNVDYLFSECDCYADGSQRCSMSLKAINL